MSRFYKPYCEVVLDGRRLTSPPLTIEFKSKTNTTSKSDQSEITIMNPSEETLSILKKSTAKKPAAIIVNAGYEDDFGTVIVGEVNNHKTKDTNKGKILEIEAGDETKRFTEAKISKTYSAGATTSSVVKDLLNQFGLAIAKLEPAKDIDYTRGVTINNRLAKALEELAEESGSEFFSRNGRMFFQPPDSNSSTSEVFLLSPSTGLLGSPTETDEGYELEALFNYKILAGDYVKVESEKLEATVKVIESEHDYKKRSRLTKLKVVEV